MFSSPSDRSRRPRTAWDRAATWLKQMPLQVLVGDRDDEGLTIVDTRSKVLVETRRAGQIYPDHAHRFIDAMQSWTLQVVLVAASPDRWNATFQRVPVTPSPRPRQTILDLEDEQDSNADAVLELRLHRMHRPWQEHDLEHVTNVVHAELHGCDAIDVHGHPTPTNCYYELEAASAHAGRLIRHGAMLNGFNMHYDPSRRIGLDADWDI